MYFESRNFLLIQIFTIDFSKHMYYNVLTQQNLCDESKGKDLKL